MIILYIQLIFSYLVGVSTAGIGLKRFGPYVSSTKTMGLCPRDNKTKYDEENACNSTVHVFKVSRTKEELSGSIHIPKDIINTGASLLVQQWTDGGYAPFINQSFQQPCDKPILKYLMKRFGNVKDNCMVPKGVFTIHDLDINEIIHMFLGNNFFYGRISIRMEWFSPKGSTCCFVAECESKSLVKLKSSKPKAARHQQ